MFHSCEIAAADGVATAESSEIEGVISGRAAADCDEAAGATRIKRLRDTLGNQIVSELLVKNIAITISTAFINIINSFIYKKMVVCNFVVII